MSGLTGYLVVLDAALAFGQSSNPANGTGRVGAAAWHVPFDQLSARSLGH